METVACLVRRGDRELRAILGHGGFPRGQFLSATSEAQVQGAADWPAARDVGDGVLGQGIGAIAVVVMPVYDVVVGSLGAGRPRYRYIAQAGFQS